MPSFVIALIALVVLAVPADATALAIVKNAFWQTDFSYYDTGVLHLPALPSGVVLSCTGTAEPDGMGGCRDSASATAVSDDGVLASTIVDRFGALSLRYDGVVPLDGTFVFTAIYGSFYPAGPGTGASVDNGGDESADYFTVVSGAGGYDLHGCNMASAPGHGGPHACHPSAPSYYTSDFGLGPLAVGGSLIADWRIYIQVDAQGRGAVPEAPTLALFLTGALAACRRKTRSPPPRA